MSLLKALRDSQRFLLNAEACPPPMDLPLEKSVEAWIDSNRLMRQITSLKRFLFMTDGAIGRREEPNLRHITINLSPETERARIVPILTTKHSLEYCLEFADRAYSLGFTSLVVLGGDKSAGVPRCVNHAWELRQRIRQRVPGLTLGGWANPHGGRQQVEYMLEPEYSADFYMAQIVSHYHTSALDDFLNEVARAGVRIPGIFGVFYYRSASPETLNHLNRYFPVPVEELRRDFDTGVPAVDICARSVQALIQSGVKNIYISNLPMATAVTKLGGIEARVEEFLMVS